MGNFMLCGFFVMAVVLVIAANRSQKKFALQNKTYEGLLTAVIMIFAATIALFLATQWVAGVFG